MNWESQTAPTTRNVTKAQNNLEECRADAIRAKDHDHHDPNDDRHHHSDHDERRMTANHSKPQWPYDETDDDKNQNCHYRNADYHDDYINRIVAVALGENGK